MPDPKQLQFLLKLLDDESDVVRESVAKELLAYGDTLEVELKRQHIQPSKQQEEFIKLLREDFRWRRLKSQWGIWQQISDSREKLETALCLLSEYISSLPSGEVITKMLNDLALDFSKTQRIIDARWLSRFLFSFKGFHGAIDYYYNPENSSLHFVLTKKKGIPISLTAVYILVGKRLGLDVEGCNFPGHFLARAKLGDEVVIVDCFHGGRILDREAIAASNPTVHITMEDILRLETTPDVMISRTLRNLVHSYEQRGDITSRDHIKSLLETMSEEEQEGEKE